MAWVWPQFLNFFYLDWMEVLYQIPVNQFICAKKLKRERNGKFSVHLAIPQWLNLDRRRLSLFGKLNTSYKEYKEMSKVQHKISNEHNSETHLAFYLDSPGTKYIHTSTNWRLNQLSQGHMSQSYYSDLQTLSKHCYVCNKQFRPYCYVTWIVDSGYENDMKIDCNGNMFCPVNVTLTFPVVTS